MTLGTNYTFTTQFDNRSVANRLWGRLEAFTVEYHGTNPVDRYTVTVNAGNTSQLPKDWTKASFVLDDGETLRLYYVAGYSQDGDTLYIDPVSAGSSLYQGPTKTFYLAIKPEGN